MGERAVSVHLGVSSALSCTGGSRHQPLGYHLSWRVFWTAPRFRTWLSPSRGRSRLAILWPPVALATSKRPAGVASMKPRFVHVVRTKPLQPVHHHYRMCQSWVELPGYDFLAIF